MRIGWTGIVHWLAEVCELELRADGLTAEGTQLGATPWPYRASYRLEVADGWITRRLEVEVAGAGSLDLRHDGAGAWDGVPDPSLLDGALDCDLAFSPLTNVMPVRRHALHERPGARDFTMAWVSLPDLTVYRSGQRYEHLAPGRVRYRSIGEQTEFVADLELDDDGLVVTYPQLARRVDWT
jgi:uncharacterized protein